MEPLLMWDEDMKDVLYATESTTNPNDSVLKKIAIQISKFIDMLIKGVTKLIDFVKRLFRRAVETFNEVKNPGTIPDTYGYVEILQKAQSIIDLYYNALAELKIVDHSMQKSGTLMDEAKSKLVSGSVFSLNRQPSSRDNYERVTALFQDIEEYDEQLDILLKPLEQEIPLKNPKLYSVHFIKKEIFDKMKFTDTKLRDLKKDLEISRDTYSQKSFIFKFMCKADIKRVNDMLTKTGSLILKVEKFEQVCLKIIHSVPEYQQTNKV